MSRLSVRTLGRKATTRDVSNPGSDNPLLYSAFDYFHIDSALCKC